MIIWGFRSYVQQLALLVARCASQGHTAAHALVLKRTKFTLFFIPLFPISSKHELVCTMCGGTAKVEKERVPEVQAEAARQQQEHAAQQLGAQQYAAFQALVTEPGPN